MALAIYARVSTEEQRERQSIQTQIEFGERYCQLHNLAVYHLYADDGVSGTVALDKRPAGSRILRDARLGRFDQLLLYKLDRLGRDTRLTGNVAGITRNINGPAMLGLAERTAATANAMGIWSE